MRLTANRFRGNIGWTFDARAPMGPRADHRDWEHCGAWHSGPHAQPRAAAVIDELRRVRDIARAVYTPRLGFLTGRKPRREGSLPPVVVGWRLEPRWPLATTWSWPPVLTAAEAT